MTHIEGIKRMVDRQLEHGKKEEELKIKEIDSLFKERARVRIVVRGKVQGVFFRDYVKKEADKMQITGWAKNTEDGGVEIVAEGDKACLRQLIILCEKGNPLSTVTNVDYDWEEYSGKFNDFYINY
jgi:acylphosphatase